MMQKAQIIAAAGMLFTSGAVAQDSSLYQGTGFGTYYYDVEQIDTCGTSFSAQNQGGVMCSYINTLPLTEMNTNYVVAMNNTQLRGDLSKYCGKKVVVTVNGVQSDLPLFIGDGCERCATGPSTSDSWDANGAPGLDFSYSVLDQLTGGSACADGHAEISWEILDETLYNFDVDGSGITQGPASGSDSGNTTTQAKVADTAPDAAASSSAAAPSSSAAAPSSSAAASSADAPVASSASQAADSSSQAPAAPTTLVTYTTQTSTASAAASSDASAAPSATVSTPATPCPTGTWQCNDNTLVQCLDGNWVLRATCAGDLTCQGGNNPYCAPAGFGQNGSSTA